MTHLSPTRLSAFPLLPPPPVGPRDPRRRGGLGRPRRGIALVIGSGAFGPDRGARDDLDRAFVETFERDAIARRCPPGAGRAAELLLRDEFGGAAGDSALDVGRDLRLAPVGDRHGEQLLVAHKTDRKSTRLNYSHSCAHRMPTAA